MDQRSVVGHVIPFPAGRFRPAHPSVLAAAAAGLPSVPGPAPAPAVSPLASVAHSAPVAVAVLSSEIRRVTAAPSQIPDPAVPKVLNRCVLAALEALNRAGAEVAVAGTPERPVLEARFEGRDVAPVAVRAAEAVRAAVRRTQRAGEHEFLVSGGVASGWTASLPGDARLESGSPGTTASRLREDAPAGQILLTDPVASICRELVETAPGEDAGAPGTWLLRGLRT
jgi:class 3 adenylate cyclase